MTLMLRDVYGIHQTTSADDEISLISTRLLIDIHANQTALSMLIYLPSSLPPFPTEREENLEDASLVKYAPINHAQVV